MGAKAVSSCSLMLIALLQAGCGTADPGPSEAECRRIPDRLFTPVIVAWEQPMGTVSFLVMDGQTADPQVINTGYNERQDDLGFVSHNEAALSVDVPTDQPMWAHRAFRRTQNGVCVYAVDLHLRTPDDVLRFTWSAGGADGG